MWISIGLWWYPDLSASHIADIAPGWGPMVRPSRHGAISWPPRAGIDGPSVCIALRKWIYIYSCGHSGQACFPDLLRFRSKVAKSLFELRHWCALDAWCDCNVFRAPGPGIVDIVVILVFFSFPGTLNINASFGTSACLHSWWSCSDRIYPHMSSGYLGT